MDVRCFTVTKGDEPKRRFTRHGPQQLTATLLRQLPFSRLEREARVALRDLVRNVVRGPKEPAELRRAAGRVAGQLLDAGSVPRYSVDHFREVARIYADAWDEGDPPTKAVAEAFGAERSTAAKWVAKARQLGFLTPTEKRRAGGKFREKGR